MKKAAWFSIFLFVAAVFPFAAGAQQNRSIFIEGKSASAEQVTFFIENFRMEAVSLGYALADTVEEAGYIFKFAVVPNMIMYDDGTQERAPPDEKQFVIMITFIRNLDEAELVTFDYQFTELEEMYVYNQLLFQNAAVNIPPIDPSEFVVEQEDDSWRNKLLYPRLSFSFPITIYTLQPTGLFEGKYVYIGDPEKPDWAALIDNQFVAMPAITLGVEVRILNWLSVEPIFQIGWENLNDKDFINMSAGLTVNFPFKFRNFFPELYAAVLFPLPISVSFMSLSPRSEIFDSFPLFGFGGGLQIRLWGGKMGIIFADISFMYYPGDVGIKNHKFDDDASIPPGFSNPQPEVIHYRRYVIGIGIGYKFGLIDRK